MQCYHKNNRRGAPWKTRHRNQQKHVTAGHVKNEEQTSKYCCNNLKIFALTTQTALRKYIIDNNNSHFCFSFEGKRIYFIWCVLTHEDQKCHTHLWKSCRGLTMSSALFKYIEAKTKQKLPPNGRLCTQHFKISCIKLLIEMSLKFVPSTTSQHCFKYWVGTEQATNHYLNQWLPGLLMQTCVTWPHWVSLIHRNFVKLWYTKKQLHDIDVGMRWLPYDPVKKTDL